MKIFITAVISFLVTAASAQKIYGTVFNEIGDLLPYASVTVKGTTIGASANDKGRFSISLPAGSYTIVCQHIGFEAQEKKVKLTDDTELSFIMKERNMDMDAVVIKSNGEDPAYEIIRQAIKKRRYYDKEVNAYSVELYSKDMIKLKNLPKRIMGRKIPDSERKNMGLDSAGQGIIYLSESVSRMNIKQPDKFKMEVVSSRVSGSGGFGFTFATNINMYTNNVQVFTDRINPRGFISPIADGALNYYKFKLLGTFVENGQYIKTIKVIPRRTYEPLFSGIINIVADEWRIHSLELLLTKTAQLEILDSLYITQQYVPVNDDVWRLKNQLMHFNLNQLGIEAGGNFLSVYSNYNLKPAFKKDFFDNVIIKYDTAVNKRSKEYWDSIRPVPLEKEEQLDYKVKDSLYQLEKDSSLSQLTIDSLNKKQGPLKLYKVILSGINRTHYSKKQPYSWGIKPLLSNLEYNTAEGTVVNVHGNFSTYLKKWKSRLTFEPHLRYGFSNDHFNAWGNLQFRTRDTDAEQKIKRYSWDFAGGKRVSEFNKNSRIIPQINSIGILLYGKNNMKTYENYFGSITYNKLLENGLRFTISGLYEDRIPLYNTTKFTLYKKDSVNITPNYPYEKLNQQFTPHQAVILTGRVSFKPGQRYIQFPHMKVPVGSKYPTFSLSYAKGFDKILGSDVKFDKWKFAVVDDINLRLGGQFRYHFGVGGFLNRDKVYIQDFKHFNGNRSLAASDYLVSFQLASFYKFSNTASFYGYGHIEHHFNGLLTNKIPLFKRLNWNLVGGSNAFFVNKNSNYVEVFAGLENILKIFRVDFVAGYENGNKGATGIRIGAGGILGGSVQRSKTYSADNISF